MAQFLPPENFQQLLTMALTDQAFQKDLSTRGFKALDDRGFQHGVPPEVQTQLEKAIGLVKPKCGVCGVCGACGLCGEIDLGSVAAALWAAFNIVKDTAAGSGLTTT